MKSDCEACGAPLKHGRLLCSHCGFALQPLVSIEDELRALDELGSFTRQLALQHGDDDDDRRAAIGSLLASAFVPENVMAIKRAFLETVQNMQPSHLSDDEGNTLLRNRCEILLTKLRMDHPEESRTIRELKGALDKRVAEWNADVATENRITWMILVPFFGIPLLMGVVFCCGGALGVF